MNWHCLSAVVTWPKIVEMMLPEPVSTMAVSVVGPSGLMSGRGLSVALPDLPVRQVDPGDVQRQPLLRRGSGRADRSEHVGRLARRRSGCRDLRRTRHRDRGRQDVAAVLQAPVADRRVQEVLGRRGVRTERRRRRGRRSGCGGPRPDRAHGTGCRRRRAGAATGAASGTGASAAGAAAGAVTGAASGTGPTACAGSTPGRQVRLRTGHRAGRGNVRDELVHRRRHVLRVRRGRRIACEHRGGGHQRRGGVGRIGRGPLDGRADALHRRQARRLPTRRSAAVAPDRRWPPASHRQAVAQPTNRPPLRRRRTSS